MSLKKKFVIIGMVLTALAPASALADSTGLIQTKVFAWDYHFSPNPGAASVYSTEDAKTSVGLETFLSTNPCLTTTAAQIKDEIKGIEKTQPYANALSNYRAQCGAASSADPIFLVVEKLSDDVNNRANQPASRVEVYMQAIVPKTGISYLSISKRKTKSPFNVEYAVNMNDKSCANSAAAVSDVNVGAVTSQMISTLQMSANSCLGVVNQKKAMQDLLQRDDSAASDLLGHGSAQGASAQGGSADTINAGCWGKTCASAGTLH